MLFVAVARIPFEPPKHELFREVFHAVGRVMELVEIHLNLMRLCVS